MVEELGKLDARLQELGLPVGWRTLDRAGCEAIANQGNVAAFVGDRCVVPGDAPQGIAARTVGQWSVWVGSKLAGWLLSGAMAAQGAPFWFDILKKVINVRSSGERPDEAEDNKDNAAPSKRGE